ncbi:MAG: site-specific integrase [Chloroflexi bacterium]|nr:site-specific integrase [Chloroflexota bacterium]
MRGHVVKRGKDSYSIVLSLGNDPATGKRLRQWVSVKGNKKDAEKKLGELLHQLDTGSFIKPDKLLFGDYLDQWLRDYCECNLAPNTTQTYAWFVEKHIKPALGQVALGQLRPEHLQRLYSDKLSDGRRDGSGGLGDRSVRYIHTTVHRALKSAVKLGMITRNPADAVDVPKVKHREMRTMDETDIHILLEHARSTEYYPLCYLALFSGMRRSELLALRWSDIDLLLCQVSVTRTLHQLHNREIIFRQPKTAKSRRLIALTPSTTSVLREHHDAQEKVNRALGIPFNGDGLVFCQPDGRPLLPDSVTQAWRHLVKRAGLSGIRLHDCRHTHASLLLKQGVHPKIVQERLGHASIQITLDTYSHVAPGLQEAAAARFDEILRTKDERESVEKLG